MTFYEAAVEVLREAGRPLHFKKITEISIRRELLSHVGKTPEITMSARLSQEVKKPGDDSLIQTIRPGVYCLKDGADTNEAKQTINLRENAASEAAYDEDEDNADVADAAVHVREVSSAEVDDDGGDASAESATDEDEDDDNARRGRRRGRRGGRNRSARESVPRDANDGEERHVETARAPKDAAPTNTAPTNTASTTSAPPTSARRPSRRRNGATHGRAESAPASPLSAAKRVPTAVLTNPVSVGDVARAVHRILEQRPEQTESLDALASELSKSRIGALARIDSSALRAELEYSNRRRAENGRPPLFEEIQPNVWSLAAASGNELANSYESLDAWQTEHADTLRRAILDRLSEVDPDTLGSIITLLLDRMGYEDLVRHDNVGDELLTLAAYAPRGLTGTRIAVRVLPPGVRVGREHVIALRGSLHNYTANEGAIISVGGTHSGAREEVTVPNLAPISLVSVEDLADHLIRTGVGLRTFSVRVGCLDESVFRVQVSVG